MQAKTLTFVVEHAGCPACAQRVEAALAPFGAVEAVDVDETNDVATVSLAGAATREAVDEALARASTGSGHEYRVRPDSWSG